MAKSLWKGLIGYPALITLIAGSFAFLAYALSLVAKPAGSTWDFNIFYTAGKIILAGSAKHLYSLRLQHQIQLRVFSGGRFLPFDHPPFEAWLTVPLGFLSYRWAYVLWAGLNFLAFMLSVYLLRFTGRRPGTAGFLVWVACSIPLVAGVLVLGQDTLLLVPVILIAFLALKKRRDLVAGLVLGAGLFRFEIMVPFIFVFLLRRRWKVVAGFAVAISGALLASLALVGWSGLLAYLRLLVVVGRTTGSRANGIRVAAMPTLRGTVALLLGGRVPSLLLFSIVVAGSLVLLVWAAWQFRHIANPEDPGFNLEFSLAAIAALLASYHLFVHELTPLIVIGYLMLAYEDGRLREGILENRKGTALLLIFALVYGVGGAVFHFRDFSVLFIVLLGMMIWLSQEISARGSEATAK